MGLSASRSSTETSGSRSHSAAEGPDAREQRGVEWAARHRQVSGDVLDDKPALLITATRLRCAASPCERFLPAIRGVHLATVLGSGAASSPRPRRSNGAEEAHFRAFQGGTGRSPWNKRGTPGVFRWSG